MELTKELLETEGTSVRWIVWDAIQSDQSDPARERRTFNFNLFDIEVDYVSASVSIQEVCSPCRDEVVSLDNFLMLFRPPSVFRQPPPSGA